MRKHLIFILGLIFANLATGQNADDAWDFSQTIFQGTAKATAMGNAMGAVGGDFTATCINPAGMGLYRSTEITASLGLEDNLYNSKYYGSNASANKFGANLPNIAFVFAKERSNYKPLRYSQFGIGLTRINDYNYHAFASGYNPTSSKVDDYLSQIPWGTYPESLDRYTLYPAYRAGVITYNNGSYDSPVPQGKLTQEYDKSFKGRSEEWTFAYSRNYANQLYFGISLGLNHIKRMGSKTLKETPDTKEVETYLKDWSFTENLSSIGWGANLKLGVIYAPTYSFRFGLCYHTRTSHSFTETWSTDTDSNFKDAAYVNYSSPVSNYSYTFLSPGKLIGSMAFIIQQRGILSLDAEAMNYGKAKFSAKDYDYTNTNNSIQELYRTSFNFRIGTEWQLNPVYLRAGVGYYGSPFGLGDSSGSIKKASCGLGVQLGNFTYFDFAYEFSRALTYFTLYDAGDLGIESVCQTGNRHLFVATMKFKF